MESGLIKRRELYLDELESGLTQEVRDILNAIDLIPISIGCKPFEETLEDNILIIELGKFIVSGYRGITAQEVGKAFDLASQRELSLDGKTLNFSTWSGGKLNKNVVGLVLTAYTRHLQFLRAQVSGFVPRNRVLEAAKEPEQTAEDVVKWLCDSIERTSEIPLAMPWGKVFKALEKTGEIVVDNESKAIYFDRVVSHKTADAISKGIGMSSIKAIRNGGDGTKSDCQRKMVITWAMGRYVSAKLLHPEHFPAVELRPGECSGPSDAYDKVLACHNGGVVPANMSELYGLAYEFLMDGDAFSEWDDDTFSALRAEAETASKNTDYEFKKRCVLLHIKEEGNE